MLVVTPASAAPDATARITSSKLATFTQTASTSNFRHRSMKCWPFWSEFITATRRPRTSKTLWMATRGLA